MLINNWFDLVSLTFFVVIMGIGSFFIYVVMLISVYQARKSKYFVWGGLFDKRPQFDYNPIQLLVTAIIGFLFSVYVLFGFGLFYKYINAVEAFLNQ